MSPCDAYNPVATAPPMSVKGSSAESVGRIYFDAVKYKGYFVGDNCTSDPDNCGGYLVQSPCQWSTFSDAQIRWSHPDKKKLRLKLNGSLVTGGKFIRPIFSKCSLQENCVPPPPPPPPPFAPSFSSTAIFQNCARIESADFSYFSSTVSFRPLNRYTYSHMRQILKAAGTNNEELLMWWWARSRSH